jgi:hypothetical protein
MCDKAQLGREIGLKVFELWNKGDPATCVIPTELALLGLLARDTLKRCWSLEKRCEQACSQRLRP